MGLSTQGGRWGGALVVLMDPATGAIPNADALIGDQACSLPCRDGATGVVGLTVTCSMDMAYRERWQAEIAELQRILSVFDLREECKW